MSNLIQLTDDEVDLVSGGNHHRGLRVDVDISHSFNRNDVSITQTATAVSLLGGGNATATNSATVNTSF